MPEQTPPPSDEPGTPKRQLLVGVFMNQQGGLEVLWGDGVEPIAMMCDAIKLLHVQSMNQKRSPILRAAGSLPRTG